MFKKYQHVERFNTDEVQDIELGTCFVFPKIDGTNGCVWLEDNEIHAGSRRRELSLTNDNAGFFEYVSQNENIKAYLAAHPKHRLYGEWLVPHTLKTYRDDAWKKFYIFDVVEIDEDKNYIKYKNFYEYQPELQKYNLDYIPVLKIIRNGKEKDFIECLDRNNFLIKDGAGAGEGIVIKNYNFVNKYGRTVWAKIVRTEFKDKHVKHSTEGTYFGIKENKPIEYQIVNKYVTQALCEKEFAKISVDGWNSKRIPELLNRIYYELINEECWHFIKEYKNPTIDFKLLNKFCIIKVKENLNRLF